MVDIAICAYICVLNILHGILVVSIFQGKNVKLQQGSRLVVKNGPTKNKATTDKPEHVQTKTNTVKLTSTNVSVSLLWRLRYSGLQ